MEQQPHRLSGLECRHRPRRAQYADHSVSSQLRPRRRNSARHCPRLSRGGSAVAHRQRSNTPTVSRVRGGGRTAQLARRSAHVATSAAGVSGIMLGQCPRCGLAFKSDSWGVVLRSVPYGGSLRARFNASFRETPALRSNGLDEGAGIIQRESGVAQRGSTTRMTRAARRAPARRTCPMDRSRPSSATARHCASASLFC